MSRYHYVSETLADRYVLTVRARDGSVVRRREYRTCDDASLLDTVPTTEELIAGYRGEVRCGGSLCWSFEPVNRKVLPLVESLREAGVVTTGSGDMYGDDLVYVDLADEWEDAVGSAKLPPGWIVTPRLANMAREALGLPPQKPDLSGESVEGVQGDAADLPGPSARMSRRGRDVSPEEAAAITAALLLAARPRYYRVSQAVESE